MPRPLSASGPASIRHGIVRDPSQTLIRTRPPVIRSTLTSIRRRHPVFTALPTSSLTTGSPASTRS